MFLVARYREKGILVDTNLLLLWFVGQFDRKSISQYKRTDRFIPEDFDILNRLLAWFPRRVTTPNVLTEVSNLAMQMGDKAKTFFESVFAKAIEVLEEHYIPSRSRFADGTLAKHGLTDCCIMSLARDKYLLLTDDFRLSQSFNSAGGDVVNFNHIRTLNW